MGNQERNILRRLEAYAPVAQMVTNRLLIATHLHIPGILFRKLDVKNAYINENMKRKVWCRVPPGYQAVLTTNNGWTLRRLRAGEKQDPTICLPVWKALYGGMECGRIFWEAWVDWHLSDGFQIIHEERCYLVKRDNKGNFIKLAYHVDDNLVAALGLGFYQDYINRLTVKFDVSEDPLSDHLGVFYDFDRVAGTCSMSQSTQIVKLLRLFGMENCKPADAPTMPGPAPCQIDCETLCDVKWDMEAFVDHVLWLYMCTRPDVGQPLKVLSRFTKKFGKTPASKRTFAKL